jgi:putative Mg2+ transporter-C (MgtC) family protein
MEIAAEDIVKLLLAILVGGIIGVEREYRDKAAGFRTMIFICVGSTLFTMFSIEMARPTTDPARIAAQIVTGVGFLGAGAIMRGTGGHVVGLTTAATIWLVAALGMGIGDGEYGTTLLGTAFVLVVLWIFPLFERWIDNRRHTDTYEIVCAFAPGRYEELETMFRECGLNAFERKRSKSGENMVVAWEARGTPHSHAELSERLFAHPDVKEFHV